jgi:hypothetical protein
VVGAGVVDPRRRDGVDLPARTGLGFGDVDHVKDVGIADAGDLNGAHGPRLGPVPERPVGSVGGQRHARVEAAAGGVCASTTKVARDDTS